MPSFELAAPLRKTKLELLTSAAACTVPAAVLAALPTSKKSLLVSVPPTEKILPPVLPVPVSIVTESLLLKLTPALVLIVSPLARISLPWLAPSVVSAELLPGVALSCTNAPGPTSDNSALVAIVVIAPPTYCTTALPLRLTLPVKTGSAAELIVSVAGIVPPTRLSVPLLTSAFNATCEAAVIWLLPILIVPVLVSVTPATVRLLPPLPPPPLLKAPALSTSSVPVLLKAVAGVVPTAAPSSRPNSPKLLARVTSPLLTVVLAFLTCAAA